MDNQDLLTFADVLKLIITFLFALILIWAKVFYEERQERRHKNEHLWRGIKQGFDNCIKGIDALNTTLDYLNKDVIVFFGLDIPQTLTDYSKRLSELENKKSHLYSDYFSKAEILRKDHNFLQTILSQAAFQDLKDANVGERIKKAIQSQINAMKGDFIELTNAELELMRYIHAKYQKNNKQDIEKMEQTLIAATNKK